MCDSASASEVSAEWGEFPWCVVSVMWSSGSGREGACWSVIEFVSVVDGEV